MSWAIASSAPASRYVVLVEIATMPPIRVHNGIGPLVWSGVEWLGAGHLGSVSAITGGSDLEAADIQISLAGVPSDYRADLLNADVRGRRVTIWHAFISDESGAFAAVPELAYAGFVSHSEQEESADDESGASLTATLFVLSAAAYARRLTIARRTDAAHQERFQGDRFYSHKTDLRADAPAPGKGYTEADYRRAINDAIRTIL